MNIQKKESSIAIRFVQKDISRLYKATFILSTGRCGTQWLHQLLESYYKDSIHSCHEPLGYEQYLNWQNSSLKENAKPSFIPALQNHIDFIKNRIQSGSYIETGSPCWSALPQWNALIPDGIQVIWVTRHPIDAVESLLSHGLYRQPLLPHQVMREPIRPDMDLAQHPDFLSKWDQMSRQEKLLYFWLEVNTMGLQLEKANVPILHLKFESLFSEDTIQEVVDFLNIELNTKSFRHAQKKIDNYDYGKFWTVDQSLMQYNHPAVKLKNQLGYKTEVYA